MLLAVLSRHAALDLQDHDVFVNTVGGGPIRDTGTDLPVLLAPASAQVAFGEVDLNGEVRTVGRGEERLHEAKKNGFLTALVSHGNTPRKPLPGLTVIAVSSVREVLEAAFAPGPEADKPAEARLP